MGEVKKAYAQLGFILAIFGIIIALVVVVGLLAGQRF